MADKAPCRYEGFVLAHPGWGGGFIECRHPLVVHFAEDKWFCGQIAKCHGCPCHEPPAKDTQRTDPPQVHDKP